MEVHLRRRGFCAAMVRHIVSWPLYYRIQRHGSGRWDAARFATAMVRLSLLLSWRAAHPDRVAHYKEARR